MIALINENDEVMVCGGTLESDVSTANCYSYKSNDGVWKRDMDHEMTERRAAPGSALLSDGRTIVIGGFVDA